METSREVICVTKCDDSEEGSLSSTQPLPPPLKVEQAAGETFAHEEPSFLDSKDDALFDLHEEDGRRRHGDSTGIDWESPHVAQLIEDYLAKRIRSLELLCWRIFEETGIAVSKMTLSRRLNGKSFLSAGRISRNRGRLHYEDVEKTPSAEEAKVRKLPERRSARRSTRMSPVSPPPCRRKRHAFGVKRDSNEQNKSEVESVWNDADIAAILSAYAHGKLFSAAEVQEKISECVGIRVPTSVLHNKLISMGLNSDLGVSERGETNVSGTPVSTVNRDEQGFSAIKTSDEEQGTGTTQRCLQSTVLTVPQGNGMVRQYMQNRTGHEKGKVKYFRCSHCATIHRKMQTNILPKLKVKNGVIVGNRFPEHHPLCRPITHAEAIAREIDRNCRRDIRLGIVTPKDAWSSGRWRAISEAERLRELSGGVLNANDDVAAAFPTWRKVRSQYLRLGLLAKTEPKQNVFSYDALFAESDPDDMPTFDEKPSRSQTPCNSNLEEDDEFMGELEEQVHHDSRNLSRTQQSQLHSSATLEPLFSAGTGRICSHYTSDNCFNAQMDVSEFRPEDLKVSVVGNFIVVEARHDERRDEYGILERRFTRKFPLPQNVPPDAVTSNLTSSGILSVYASVPQLAH